MRGRKGRDRPWPPEERKAVWFDVFDPDGRRLGMLLGIDQVEAWVGRRPGVWWRVVHWYDGRIDNRWLVRAKVRRKRGKPRRTIWRRIEATKGGGRGDV